jgi:hypothetical protein
MVLFRVPCALVLVLAAVLVTAGCVGHPPGPSLITAPTPSVTAMPTGTIPVQPSPIAGERKVYTVIQGDPFIYQGIVNDTDIQTVDVLARGSSYQGSIPLSVPVNANGTFTVIIDGNFTKEFRDDYTRLLNYTSFNQDISQYLHVSLNFTTRKEYFDLLIVQDAKNLTISKPGRWVRIGPLQDVVIQPDEQNDYSGPFLINGTTNLPAGENLSLALMSWCNWPCPKQDPSGTGKIGCCGNIDRYVMYTKVQENPAGANTWSFLINTAPDRIVIGRENGMIGDTNLFEVFVTGVNRTAGDNEWDLADFVIRVRGVP